MEYLVHSRIVFDTDSPRDIVGECEEGNVHLMLGRERRGRHRKRRDNGHGRRRVSGELAGVVVAGWYSVAGVVVADSW